MQLLKQINNECPIHVKVPLVNALNQRLAALPRFQGLWALPEWQFSSVLQLTGKEYHEIAKIDNPAIAPLLINHLQHLEAIRSGIDFMLLASYESHTESTIEFLQNTLI